MMLIIYPRHSAGEMKAKLTVQNIAFTFNGHPTGFRFYKLVTHTAQKTTY